MNNPLKYNTMKRLFFILMIALFSGCAEYLDNPLKDKETGDDINLLLIDFNFFNTRISVKLIDVSSGSLIDKPATVRFTGENGKDIVTFAGEKRPEFNVTNGQLEVTVDPNFSISENSPFRFAVSVSADGYNSLSKGFILQSEGKKTIELKLSNIDDESESEYGGEGPGFGDGDTSIVITGKRADMLKSAQENTQPYNIEYEISISSFLKFKDETGKLLFTSNEELMDAYNADPSAFLKLKVSTFRDYEPGTDVVEIDGQSVNVLFHQLETGRLTELRVADKKVADLNGGVIQSRCIYSGMPAPDLFGFAEFSSDRWRFTGTETIYNQLNFSYAIAKASTEELCASGSKITFTSNVISSFSLDADVFDVNDNLLTYIHFKGSFPETFTVENTPNQPVKIVFRNNNPSFQSIPPVEISNFCAGSYQVNVQPATGYKEYQIVLRAFCRDNPTIAFAPTYSGEYKIKSSDDVWQGADMKGGVVDLLGLPGQEYEYRLLWENSWEYSTLITEFDEKGDYRHPSGSKIRSEQMSDGRIRIFMEHTFNQNICDDLGW